MLIIYLDWACELTSGNTELAEDISQQAFMKSFTYLKSFNSQKKFKHWLTGIAVNCYKDLIQKENQHWIFKRKR